MVFTLDAGTISSGFILFIVSAIVLHGIFLGIRPKFVLKNDKDISSRKILGYSIGISFLFSIGIVFISLQVDKQYAKKHK